MNNTNKRILKELEAKNKTGKYALVSRETGKLLHALIKSKKPKNVLEVGTSLGYSAIWIASALPKGSKLTCIDEAFRSRPLPILTMAL